jgi:hypothetical protein
MHGIHLPLLATPILSSVFLLAVQAQVSGNKFAVERGSLCVTEGNVESTSRNQWSVDTQKMRAYVNGWTSDAIEARFTYLGGTAEESRLGSGEIRRQFGLKLRAQNACNLVYAMWRIEPESKVVVSVKRNPSQSTSLECGNRGYENIKPRRSKAAPPLKPGESHTLGAEIKGSELTVFIDRTAVWEGGVGPEASDLKGPVGIRSDNVRMDFVLNAGAFVGIHPDFRLACKSGAGLSD